MTTNFKEILLGIFLVASSIVTFWFWSEVMPLVVAGELEKYVQFIVPVAGLMVSGAIFSLSSVFIKNGWFVYSISAIAVSAPYLFTAANGTVITLLAISIFFAIIAAHRMRKEFLLSLGFSLTKIFRSGVPLYLTIASLIVSAFYLSLVTEETAIPALLPRSTLNFTLNRLSEPLSSFTGVPKISTESTVDEVLVNLLQEQLKNQGIAFSQIPKQELQKALVNERASLEERYGIKIKGGEKVGDLFYDAITTRMQDLLGPYRSYLPFASAVAFFFAFKAFTIPLYYLSLLITLVLIKLLVFTKILRSEKVAIEVDRLTL